MNKIYRAKYKCRLCGKKYYTVVTGNDTTARVSIIGATHSLQMADPLTPAIKETHYCADGSYGVSDLLGFEVEGG